jgi:excisionase family DNA binding protein
MQQDEILTQGAVAERESAVPAPEPRPLEQSSRFKELNGVGGPEACPISTVNVSASQPHFEPILNSDQAAALLQIHPKTLQRMARQGRIPAHRIGDLWRFRASELDAWLRSKMVDSEPPLVP